MIKQKSQNSILYLFTIVIIFFSSFVKAQKLYIWCPIESNIIERTKALENIEIDVIIFDGRIISTKSKVECSSESLSNKIFDAIKKAYPSAKVNLLSNELYYSSPRENAITIKIRISAYHSAFGVEVNTGIGVMGGNLSYGIFPSGKWNAVTNYYLKLYDERNDGNLKFEKEILRISSKGNTGGFTTAKNILSQTYNESIQELLFFLDSSLMK